CLAGGVALNCVGNGRILREKIFENIWVQPAAGDAGGAVGAALFGWYQVLGHPRVVNGKRDAMKGALLGPEYGEERIKKFLEDHRVPYTRLGAAELLERTADLIVREKVIGWFAGRMEFGPRALGARSILADARSKSMQTTLNLKIKFREGFRPFAPSVLREKVSDYFELESDSPYMLMVAPVKGSLRRPMTDGEKGLFGIEKLNVVRSSIPAVTHVDYSARIQTVSPEDNPLFYRLLKVLDEKHGCPVLVNTSFNVRGEPLVCTPEDAYLCFMRTEMDVLVLGNFLLEKTQQPPLKKDTDWAKQFQLD
ncbi:MAG: hypothetical protein HYZ87_03295, partial [Candidatus Omnitrophica bacterium]|nr:hypothetical protein [Candidatus Omnitrophota bacterium]